MVPRMCNMTGSLPAATASRGGFLRPGWQEVGMGPKGSQGNESFPWFDYGGDCRGA